MDEIRRLQEQLSKLQVLPSVHRLSDRNVVEIVSKLRERGLIEVMTTASREYLTPQRLEREISDQVFSLGGRANLVDIAPALEVDLPRVEERAKELCKKDRTIKLIGGELISSTYLDSVGAEIEELLAESGHASLDALSRRFNLATDTITEVASTRVQGARLRDGSLYTDGFVSRHLASVRGYLTALTRPAQLSTVITRGDFNAAGSNLFDAALEDLIAGGRVEASVGGRGDRAVLHPAAHDRSVDAALAKVYRDNGYIENETVVSLGVAAAPRDVKAVLRGRLEGCVALETVHVSPGLIGQLAATIDEARGDGSWIDPSQVLPSPFTAQDVTAAVNAAVGGKNGSATSKSGGMEIVGRFAVSKTVVENVEKAVAEALGNAVRDALAKKLSLSATKGGTGNGDDDDDDADGGGDGKNDGAKSDAEKASAAGGGGGKMTKRQLRQLQQEQALLGDRSDSDSDGGNAGGKKGKKKGGKKGKKSNAAGGAGGKKSSSSSSPGTFDPLEGDLPPSHLASILASLPESVLPEGHGGDRDDLCASMSDPSLCGIHSRAALALESARREASASGNQASDTRDLHDRTAAVLREQLEALALFHAGAVRVCDANNNDNDNDDDNNDNNGNGKNSNKKGKKGKGGKRQKDNGDEDEAEGGGGKNAEVLAQLEKGLVKSIGLDAARTVVECLYLGVASGETLALATAKEVRGSVAAFRDNAGAAADKELAGALTKMCDLLESGDDVSGLIDAIAACGMLLGIRSKPLDKKRERTLLTEHKARLSAELGIDASGSAGPSDASEALLHALPLLYVVTRGACVQWPRRLVSRAIDMLEGDLPEEDHATLRKCGDAVAAAIRGEDAGADPDTVRADILAVAARALAAQRK